MHVDVPRQGQPNGPGGARGVTPRPRPRSKQTTAQRRDARAAREHDDTAYDAPEPVYEPRGCTRHPSSIRSPEPCFAGGEHVRRGHVPQRLGRREHMHATIGTRAHVVGMAPASPRAMGSAAPKRGMAADGGLAAPWPPPPHHSQAAPQPSRWPFSQHSPPVEAQPVERLGRCPPHAPSVGILPR